MKEKPTNYRDIVKHIRKTVNGEWIKRLEVALNTYKTTPKKDRGSIEDFLNQFISNNKTLN